MKQTMSRSPTETRALASEMRWALIAASVLVFAMGTALFVFAASTDSYFAWTVNPAITAAFMGAGFLAAGVLELRSARERDWSNARAGVVAVFVFTVVMLGVTLYHIDRFHTGEPRAWIWIAVYVAFPFIIIIALLRQARIPGEDPPRTMPLPDWLRVLTGVQAAVMLVVGIGLLAVPTSIAPHWPWQLSALTGRAIGAWLIGFGIAAAQATVENDVKRVSNVALSSIVFPALLFIALVRYQDQVTWSSATAWLLVFFLASVLFVGAVTFAGSREPGRFAERA